MVQQVKTIIENKKFENLVTAAIVANALTLGLETVSSLGEDTLATIHFIDKVFITFFVFEVLARIYVYRFRFFKDPWGVFDFAVVSVALVPAVGSLSALRAFRVLRTLRVISTVPTLRRVVVGLLSAIPGLGAVVSILTVIFYVGAVISTNLFGEQFPQWFGSVYGSAYSLFQIMTLESWSMGIVRPVMEAFPGAWLFFIPFILVTTFTMLNLFIAVIVNGMQAETDAAADERALRGEKERAELLEELHALRTEVKLLSSTLKSSINEQVSSKQLGGSSSKETESSLNS